MNINHTDIQQMDSLTEYTIRCRFEKSDHDDECAHKIGDRYFAKGQKIPDSIVDVPKTCEYSVWEEEITIKHRQGIENMQELVGLVPKSFLKMKRRDLRFCWCSNSLKSRSNGLWMHDWRITILTDNPCAQKYHLECKFEISDHDGYCSAEDCDYETWEDNIDIYGDEIDIENYQVLAKYLPKIIVNTGDTFLCAPSLDVDDDYLSRHDYRITILSAEPYSSSIKSARN